MSSPAVALCNQALRLLGEGTITSFTEGTELANTCATLWQDTARGLLASYPWRFTLRKAELSRLADAPINEWPYAHQLPPGQLVLRQIFASPTPGVSPLLEYERFEDQVLARQPQLWADYQAEVDPALWPPAFALLARYALAADFAVPVAGSMSAAEWWDRKAFGGPGEARMGGQMGVARRLDAQQQPPQAITDFPLIDARNGSFAQARGPSTGPIPAIVGVAVVA
jgi:hypothetical protein